jgi:cobaltochelatase CobN
MDVELIPSEELNRPRIDVFVETKHHYNDYLESRTKLIDRAIRLVSDLNEPDNYVFMNRMQIRGKLEEDGLSGDRAEMLSRARIFAVSPGRFGSGLHDVLFESTGVWDKREQLTEVYMAQHDFVYTMGCWGVKAPETYRRQLEGTEIVLRSFGKHGALTGRASYSGANLCMAVEHLTGKTPDYFIADLRMPGDESIERAEDLLRRDFRAILFNRKWIEGMKGEGANGAARMAALTWKALAWKITRKDSVNDRIWEEIVETYLHDKKNLHLREFFEQTNPGALQEIAKNLLEAVRKDYWRADPAIVAELASTLARSIVRHGREIDANEKLDRFVEGTLLARGSPELNALLHEFMGAAPAAGPAPPNEVASESTEKPAVPQTPPSEHVKGQELAPSPPDTSSSPLGWIIAAAAVLLLVSGIVFRRGAI